MSYLVFGSERVKVIKILKVSLDENNGYFFVFKINYNKFRNCTLYKSEIATR